MSERRANKQNTREGVSEEKRDPLPFLLSEVQLQNTFVIEIHAKRLPIEQKSTPNAELNLERVIVNEAASTAEVVLALMLSFAEEPQPFEISFKLLGQFIYDPVLTPEQVKTFLEQGSLSVMQPFVRETLFSICTRLQLPPIMLPMIKLAPPIVTVDKEREDVSENS